MARYRVERCQGTTCTNFTDIDTSVTPAYVNTGLPSGTTYRYRVRAEDQAGNLSGYSAIVTLGTLVVTPTDITAPIISNITTSSTAQMVIISAATNEPTALRIEYGLASSTLTMSASSINPTTAHALILSNLTRRTTYYYRVTATDLAGNRTVSGVSSFTTSRGKTAPIENLNAVYGSVILSWGVVSDPFARMVVIHRTSDGTYPAVSSGNSVISTITDRNLRSYRDTTARDGTTYYYTIYGIDDEGVASDPARISFTPRAPSSGGGGGGGGKPKPKNPITQETSTDHQETTNVVTTPTPGLGSQSIVTTPAFTQPLFVGSQDSEVLKLQQFLINQGFLASDSATGLYGQATESAVKRYQCARNIVCGGTGASTGYGLVGNATRLRLNQEVPGTTTTITTPGTTTPEQRQALIQSLLAQVQVLMARLRAMQGL